MKRYISISFKDFNEKYTKNNINVINKFYSEYYKDSKNDTEKVGWSSKKEQNKRFEVLLNIGFKNKDSILDFGCGLGALYEYMNKKYDNFKYIGVDINEDFINNCKKKYPKILFKKIENINDIKYKYDWFVSSGAFTVYTPIDDMLKTIKKAFKCVKYGISVIFLEKKYTKNSDLSAIRGYDKKEIYKLFLNEFKEFHTVELHDNYLENEFTIYIKKMEYFY